MEKKTKKTGKNVKGLYAALAICLVAAAAAAWATYDSISKTISGNRNDTAAPYEAVQPAAETVSGVAESSTPDRSEPEESEQKEEPAAAPAEMTFVPPLHNGIVDSFSGETLVYSETLKDWRSHNGTDFQAEEGEPVLAIADGTVRKVEKNTLLGTVVTVEHGEITALYCGLVEDVPVEKGDEVSAGDTIGIVGTIPSEQAKGPHLHLEAKRDGKRIDPVTLFP